MSDGSMKVPTARFGTKTFEANSKPEVVKGWTELFGNSTKNDFSIPLKAGDKTVYLKQEQVDAIFTACIGAAATERAGGEGKITISVGGQDIKMNADDALAQLKGKGTIATGR